MSRPALAQVLDAALAVEREAERLGLPAEVERARNELERHERRWHERREQPLSEVRTAHAPFLSAATEVGKATPGTMPSTADDGWRAVTMGRELVGFVRPGPFGQLLMRDPTRDEAEHWDEHQQRRLLGR